MIVKYVVCGCEHIAGVVIQGLGGGPSSIRAVDEGDYKRAAYEQERSIRETNRNQSKGRAGEDSGAHKILHN